jgi:arylsulfatase A-like enzyme
MIARIALLGMALASAQAFAAKPNFLVVYTDDQAFDTIHALGNPQIQTPNLDALVERGFTFTNAYCQGGQSPAVCVPSRTMFLTGRSTFRTPPYNAKTYDKPTLGGVFKNAGYATLCVSKPGNSFRPAHEAFEKVVHIPHVGAETNKKCADAAIEYLKEGAAGKPFFIYYAPSMPHDPRTAEPEFHKLYDPAKIELPKNWMKEQPIDIGVRNIRDEKLAPYPRDEAEMKKQLAEYYACITSLDHHLGRIFDALKKAGTWENTIVVFTSDQGLAVGGRHGHMGKQNLYEHFKSPLVVAGPGIPKGKSDALVYLYDLFPTLCDLSGTTTPKECEGVSLVPVMKGEKKAVRDTLFAVYMDSQRMVRNDRWKLLWYPKIGMFQLFDLHNDPNELRNLADAPEQAERLTTMKKLMAGEQTAFGDTKAPKPQ